MRNRKVQRQLRRDGFYKKDAIRTKEELIDRHNACGISDPTPFLAVKNIVAQERKAAIKAAKAKVKEREAVNRSEARALVRGSTGTPPPAPRSAGQTRTKINQE